jgi:hypothetical protein
MPKCFCSCIRCYSQISTNNLDRHYLSRLCLSGGKYIPLNNCPYCKEDKSRINEDFANHIKWCNKNPNISTYKNGKGSRYNTNRTAWNKGKGSKLDLRNPEYVGKIGGYRANAGRSKKFKVTDSFGKTVCLQSSFELKCSEILNNLSIQWIRPKSLKYNNKNYFADFYLLDYDIYLDPKNNYKAKIDKEKINAVMQQNNVKVFILLEENITQEYIAGLTQLARVAS